MRFGLAFTLMNDGYFSHESATPITARTGGTMSSITSSAPLGPERVVAWPGLGP